jgi:hypothetical protein
MKKKNRKRTIWLVILLLVIILLAMNWQDFTQGFSQGIQRN